MTIFFHELKRGKLYLAIWTLVISFMLGICIIIYPEMSADMNDISDVFAEMGAFSNAFGLDQINFGEFIGFFGIECGNVLGMGGAFFAAILGASALAKEEKDKTAEFLLTHPVSRTKIITQKLLSVYAQITILNIVVITVTAICTLLIGEKIDWSILTLILLAYYLLQLEIASITFGVSAFIRRGSLGIGLGIAVMLYFLNIVANLTEQAKFIKYITPFGFCDSADIIADERLNAVYLSIGLVISVVAVLLAYIKYTKKDIA